VVPAGEFLIHGTNKCSSSYSCNDGVGCFNSSQADTDIGINYAIYLSVYLHRIVTEQ